jgi:hypothetical protein
MSLPPGGLLRRPAANTVPRGVPRIDPASPLAQGLTGLWLVGAGSPLALVNLVTGIATTISNYNTSFPFSPTVCDFGRGAMLNEAGAGYQWNVGPASSFYGSAASFGLINRFSTSLVGAPSFGEIGTNFGVIYLPYSDGNAYIQIPSGTSVDWASPYTLGTRQNWLISAGPAGRFAWKNGQQVYGTTGTTNALSPSGKNFGIGGAGSTNGSTSGQDNQEIYLFAIWNRQLSPAEAVAFTVDPRLPLIFPGDRLWLYGKAISSGITVSAIEALPHEFLATALRGGRIPGESLMAASRAAAAAGEFAASPAAPARLPAEIAATFRFAGDAAAIEFLAGIRAGFSFADEALVTAVRDAGLPAEFLASVRAVARTPDEFAGAILLAVAAAEMLPLEWLATEAPVIVSLWRLLGSPGRTRLLATPGWRRLLASPGRLRLLNPRD